MQHRVVVAVTDGMPLFELAAPCEVFGRARQDFPVPWWYDLRLCAGQPGPVRTADGLRLDTGLTLDDLVRADTVIVPACRDVPARTGLAAGVGAPAGAQPRRHPDTPGDPPPELLDALREAHARGARVASICTGAFILAAAGLLDGRQATTHWMHAEEFTRRWPAVRLNRDVLYTEDDGIFTSAGSAAGLDLCLHLVRRDHGSRVANTLARRMVMPPHRDGGQAQYVEQPLSAHGTVSLAPVMDWARGRLHRPLTVEELAVRARLSPRTFARRFRATTGTTPLQWLLAERVRHAQELLETTDETVDRIATRCGFGSAQGLRTHFIRANHVTPHEFRRTFRGRTDGAGATGGPTGGSRAGS